MSRSRNTSSDPSVHDALNGSPPKRRRRLRLSAADGNIAAVAKPEAKWLVERWTAWIHAVFSAELLHEGLERAQLGQVLFVQFEQGRVWANVQERSSRPFEVEFIFDAAGDAQWKALLRSMAEEAQLTAALMTGDFPGGMQALLEQHEIVRFGVEHGPVRIKCRNSMCRRMTEPCPHSATAALVAGEELGRNPLLVFALSGWPVERLLSRLREQREVRTQGLSAAHPEPMLPEMLEQATPLELSLEEFWGSTSALRDVEKMPPPEHASQALLRRLGPSPLGGNFPLVGLLASVYETVAEKSRAMRDRLE